MFVEVTGAELGTLLVHGSPQDMQPGILHHLDEKDRELIKKLAREAGWIPGEEKAQQESAQVGGWVPRPLRYMGMYDEADWAWRAFSGPVHEVVSSLRGLAERFNAVAQRIDSPLRFLVFDRMESPFCVNRAGLLPDKKPLSPQPHVVEHGYTDLMALPTDLDFIEELLGVSPGPVSGETASQLPQRHEPRRLAEVFVSYAREDLPWVRPFLARLSQLCRHDTRFEITFWRDQAELGFGPFWPQIDEAIKRCDMGLLFLSEQFLDSTFIRDHELPHFNYHGRGNRKPCAVLDCVRTDRARVKQRGISASQIVAPTVEGAAVDFAALDLNAQDRFLQEVAGKLLVQLDSLPLRKQTSADLRLREIEAALSVLPADSTPHLQRNRATKARWSDFEQSGDDQQHAAFDAPLDAVGALLAWATNESALPFCALLGQYGQGKSTTLKRLARELFLRRGGNRELPVPIYVDLRLGAGIRDGAPMLTELLSDYIQRQESLLNGGVTAVELVELVRQRGAVMIFDGFDEVAVHLTANEAQRFANELWKVLPDPSLDAGEFRGKLLISSRSHFFRNVREQARVFLSMARRAIRENQRKPERSPVPPALANVLDGDFLFLVLLPFDRAQVVSYFTDALGSAKLAESTMATIERIHNLTELSRRPVLLPVLAHCLPSIELASARQEVVNAAAVYDYMVEEWLGRDVGKHKIRPRHKQLLMEELAAKLYRESRQELSASQLDEWLETLIRERNEFAHAYPSNLGEMLESDLRTATFVIRTEHSAEVGMFRFAHTSLSEYFFACHLVRGLEQQRLEAWQVRLPSVETLEFIVQLLARRQPAELDVALKSWASLLERGGDAAAIAFRCWLIARRDGMAQPDPARVVLDGADLSEVEFQGEPEAIWNLSQASFRRAWLMRTRWRWIEADAADFRDAQLSDAVFEDCMLDGANFEGACVEGVHIRFGSTRGCSPRHLAGEVQSRYMLQSEEARRHGLGDLQTPADARVKVARTVSGHSAALVCAASAAASLFAVGYEGGGILLWDALTGRCFREIGDWNAKGGIVFSPDGRRLLVPSAGGSISVWYARSGARGKQVRNRFGEVVRCAFAPDSDRFLTGSEEGVVQLWSTSRQNTALSIVHTHSVREQVEDCLFSRDGRKVAVAMRDEVYCYDVSTATPHLICRLPGQGRFGVAFSNDTNTLVTVSADCKARFWDTATSLEHRVIRLHSEAGSILPSPDTRHLAVRCGDNVTVVDARTGKSTLALWHSVRAASICFVGDDRLMLGLQDGSLEVYELAGGRCLRKLPGRHERVLAGRASLEEQDFSAEYHSREPHTWIAHSETTAEPVPGWRDGLRSLDMSPGQNLRIDADESSLWIRDVDNARCLRVWHLLPGEEYAVFDPRRSAPVVASSQAWRYFDTQVRYANGRVHILPAEAVTGRWPGC